MLAENHLPEAKLALGPLHSYLRRTVSKSATVATFALANGEELAVFKHRLASDSNPLVASPLAVAHGAVPQAMLERAY